MENKPLYQGSQTTLLSTILFLVNIKVMNDISNIGISHMLRYSVIFVIFYVRIPLMFFILTFFFHWLIGECFLPPSNILPFSYQELSVIMKDIGIEYQTIHACPNDHIIYHKQHEIATQFLNCHIIRYWSYQLTKKVPHKVFWYIPIILRLQALFSALAWNNLWITMHTIEFKTILCECLRMILHLIT